MICRIRRTVFQVEDYDLDSTLASGQAFRWEQRGPAWESVVGGHWVRLRGGEGSIAAETTADVEDWAWLADYLQAGLNLRRVIKTFPKDPPMRRALRACKGLRLLRQDPWECLASFILSSTKQIVQIQQIVRLLCERFGRSVRVPIGSPLAFAFPTVGRLAGCTEADLRACKMGFRAPYLLETAQKLAAGELDLNSIRAMSIEEARGELLRLPGVGHKIADCVLLFAYGFPGAFPVDVWVTRALSELYFDGCGRVRLQEIQDFSVRHFGPHAGYAQQYLFHFMRTKNRWTSRLTATTAAAADP